LTLEGASKGVQAYIGEWDTSVLVTRPEIWSTAVSQILFSLSLTSGIMTAYGSCCPRKEPALYNTGVIALANSTFSFLSGFAVFGSLGHLASMQNIEIEDIDFRSGFGLVFGTWPVVLRTIPGGIHWVRICFFNLFVLGIDGSFSSIEAIIIVFEDTALFRGTVRWKLAAFVCLSSWIMSVPMYTDAGLVFLDTLDFYINYMLVLTGFLQTFAVGWVSGLEDQVKSIGALPCYLFMFGNIGSILFASGFWWGMEGDNVMLSGIIAFLGFNTVHTLLAVICLSTRRNCRPWSEVLYVLFAKNVYDFKAKVEPVIGWVPGVWCLLMKYFIPQVLLLLFINLAASENEEGKSLFGNYSGELRFQFLMLRALNPFFSFPLNNVLGYVIWPYQALGIFFVVLVGLPFAYGLVDPDSYACFISEEQALMLKEAELTTVTPPKEQQLAPPTVQQDTIISHKDDADVFLIHCDSSDTSNQSFSRCL